MKDLNTMLQLKCQGLEEITCGLMHSDKPELTAEDLDGLQDRAEDVIRLVEIYREKI